MPEMYILFQGLRNHHRGSPITTLGDDGKVAGVLQGHVSVKGYPLLVIPAQAGIQVNRQRVGGILAPELLPWIPDNHPRG